MACKEGDGETAAELYSFLKEHPECDIEAETFAEDHLSIDSIARAYSFDLEAAGNIEKAIVVLQAYFGKDGPNSDHDKMAKKYYEWTMLKGAPSQREQNDRIFACFRKKITRASNPGPCLKRKSGREY